GCNPTLVIEINPRHDNRNTTRHLLTIGKYILSTFLFILTVPFHIVIAARNLGSRIKKTWE
ncbi:MAG TPA: hypothetical protein VIJ14_05715, partial [Rhabdochlamydiaceae bacterium]